VHFDYPVPVVDGEPTRLIVLISVIGPNPSRKSFDGSDSYGQLAFLQAFLDGRKFLFIKRQI